MQQVRHKLASRKAIPEGDVSEHPGGARQNPPKRQVTSTEMLIMSCMLRTVVFICL